MPLEVLLSSGAHVETTTKPGAKVSVLREELSVLLGTQVGGIELTSEASLLEDPMQVPDGVVNVLISSYAWLDDGSGTIKDLGGNAFSVEGAVKGGTPVAALCDISFSHGEIYFEVEVVAGEGAWTGVGTKDNFKIGWQCKGIFYGGPGNLSNGGGGLRMGWGKAVVPGSVVGCAMDLSDPCSISMDIWHDGKHLGTAFKGCPRERDAAVYPIVRAKQAGDSFRLSLRQKVRVPPAAAAAAQPPHPAEGDWKLARFTDGQEVVDLSVFAKGKGKGGKGGAVGALKVAPVSVHSPPEPSTFRLSLKLGNTMNCTATVTPAERGDDLVLGGTCWTMMMIMGPLGDLERRIDPILSTRISGWSVTNAGANNAELVIFGTDVRLVFEPYDPTPSPVAGAECDVLLPKKRAAGYNEA